MLLCAATLMLFSSSLPAEEIKSSAAVALDALGQLVDLSRPWQKPRLLPRPASFSTLEYGAMNRKIPIFLLMLVVSVCARAEGFPPTGVRFDFGLSSSAILAGAPVSVIVKLRKEDGNPEGLRSNFHIRPDWGHDILLTISDEQGKSCGGARAWPVWPARQRFSNWIGTDEGQFDLPLHMRRSTELPPGKYFVKCSVPSVELRRKNADGTSLPRLEGVITSPPLMLEVLPADSGSTTSVYDALLLEGLKAQSKYDATHAGSLGDWMDYVPELRRLLWAWGAAAAPVQLRAIHDGHYFRFSSSLTIFVYQNILEHASPEIVERLVSIAQDESLVQTRWGSNSFDPNLVWALDELRKRGTPQYVALIEPVLARFKTPIDLDYLEKPLPD